MQFFKYGSLLGLAAAFGGVAQAQVQQRPPTITRSFTTVDPYGNVTRTTSEAPATAAGSIGGLIANQGVYGSSYGVGGATPNSSFTISNNYGTGYSYSTGYGNVGNSYCPPGYAYPPAYAYPYPNAYPYPYPNTAVNNNYYYPAQPYSMPLGTPAYNWSHVPTITNIPLGTQYTAGPGPSYPAYPAYPYPAYQYPAYTGTYYNGYGTGSITTQSQTGGFRASVGQGGVSIGVGKRTNSSTTTITTR